MGEVTGRMAPSVSQSNHVRERIVRDLSNFGFPAVKVHEAIEALGDQADVQLIVDWLLDHGEEDKGGAVQLRHCPHVHELGRSCLIGLEELRFGCPCIQGCSSSENWVCLLCGETRCGRYSQKHSLSHWEDTKQQQESQLTVADAVGGLRALGHCIALGTSDLSVWCYECRSYVQHEHLETRVKQMETLKF